jgi:hypothetical protein
MKHLDVHYYDCEPIAPLDEALTFIVRDEALSKFVREPLAALTAFEVVPYRADYYGLALFRPGEGTITIRISQHPNREAEHYVETIIHEFCHVLQYIDIGPHMQLVMADVEREAHYFGRLARAHYLRAAGKEPQHRITITGPDEPVTQPTTCKRKRRKS